MTRAPLIAVFSILLLASCKKEGDIPAYVQLNAPQVVDANGALISSKITDVWVFLNDKPVGVWESGRTIPLIGAGDANLKVISGVRNNGVTDDRIQYPFYATWQQQVQLVPEQTIEITPQVKYYEGLNYWLADFEGGIPFDTVDCTASITTVLSDTTLIAQGASNGVILLDPEHALCTAVSSGDPFYTTTGSIAFLEMDYRSDTRIQVGVRYQLAGVQYQVAYAYATPTKRSDGSMPWNKVYFDLATPWDAYGAMDKRFYIQVKLENGATSGEIQMDNIKLVRF